MHSAFSKLLAVQRRVGAPSEMESVALKWCHPPQKCSVSSNFALRARRKK